MINYDTLFDDENKDLLAKLEAESAGLLGRLDNKGRVGNSGIEVLRTNGGMPEYDSPFGANSLLFNGGQGGYVTFVNFKRLIPFLNDYKGNIVPYYFGWYESHSSVSINQFSSSVPSIIPSDDEKSGHEDIDIDDPITKKIKEVIGDIITSTIEKRVDEEYIGKNGKAIFLDGKLNVKEGYIKVCKEAIGFSFKLDPTKRSISFIDYLFYVDKKTGKAAKEWALQIEAYNYEYYLALCEIEGLFLTEGSKLSIVRKFTTALKNAKDNPATMAWLYFKMPDFVFLQRNKNLLIDDLTGILKGNVNEDAIHTEATVLKILQAFVTDNKADQDNLLYELTTRMIEKQTLFEVLYRKMNDAFGADNWTAAIQLLYKIWSASSYADENKYKYAGQPERLAYQSEKILGFYNSGFDFSFEQNRIEVKRDRETAIGEGQVSTEKIHYTSYGYFQQIVLQEIEQDGELKIPSKIPAFYLKAFDDKNKWYNYDKTAWVVADIALTFTAVGNLAKLRYLTYLSKTAMYVRLTYGSIFLASSLTQTMLNFVNDCSGSSFCEKLKTYLFWLDLATISLDAITEKMLRKSAREALDAADSKVPQEIRKHLDDVALEASVYRTKKLEVLAKASDNVIKEILEFEAKNINSSVEVGLIYNKAKKVEIFIGSGQIKTIVLDAKQVAKLRGSIVTHIHPNGSSFSIADLKLFFTQDIKELRAVCPDGVVFSLKNKTFKFTESDFEQLLKNVKYEIEETYVIGMKQTDNPNAIEILETERLIKSLEKFMKYIMFE